MGLFNAHKGSWGTPDLGVTEWLANRFGQIRTSTHGSNLSDIIGNQTYGEMLSDPTNPYVSQQISPQSRVAGATDTAPSNSPTNIAPSSPTANITPPSQPTNIAPPSPPNQETFDPYASLRNEISSAWDNYINSLNSQLEGLSAQRAAQEKIVKSQYDQGVNQLGLQRDQGLRSFNKQRAEAEANQAKSLRDLTANIRNLFQTGNTYLGGMGAGDSSAANQYSYALTKLGTKQRSDITGQTSKIMNDINERQTNLQNIYDAEIRNLAFERDQKINSIAQWFSEQQNAIRQAQASGQLGKSQDLANLSKDILNRALSELDRINQQTQEKSNALDQWAIGVSQNIEQLKRNMLDIASVKNTLPRFNPISGAPRIDQSGNLFANLTGYGYSNEEEKKGLFN